MHSAQTGAQPRHASPAPAAAAASAPAAPGGAGRLAPDHARHAADADAAAAPPGRGGGGGGGGGALRVAAGIPGRVPQAVIDQRLPRERERDQDDDSACGR